jgi:hypothetical protein
MRFNCGPTAHEKRIARRQWHRWFAWFPVRVGSRDCRWLETIERRYVGYTTYAMREYREALTEEA